MDKEEALYWLKKVFPNGHASTDIYGRPVFFMWFLPAQSIEIPEGMVFAKDLESITKLIIDSFISNSNWNLGEIRQLLKDKDNLKEEIKTTESYLAILQTLASEYIETNYIPFTLPEKDYRARLMMAIKTCKDRNTNK